MNDRSTQSFRLAILGDYPEEGWPSMDLVEQMLLDELHRQPLGAGVAARSMRPQFQRRFARLPFASQSPAAANADRMMNRLIDYPRYVRGIGDQFDCFHICDHSYSQLALELPVHRTGVFCHDLDTFRCLIEPARDRRPKWFRAMSQRILRGMQRAAVVFHTTRAVRDEIIRHQLIDPAKLICAPCGVAPEYFPSASTVSLPGVPSKYVLHVGSCTARKRIDVLLDTIAKSGAFLVQIGGTWTGLQRDQIARLRLTDRVTQLPRQSRAALANLYRRANAVLITSDDEGFGLPIIEALACGTPVIASDIAALREVGGDAVTYRSVGDSDGFAEVITANASPSRAIRLARATKFSWTEHAQIILNAYRTLAGGAK